MNKKWYLLLITLLIITMGVIACGGADEPAPPAEEEAPAAADDEAMDEEEMDEEEMEEEAMDGEIVLNVYANGANQQEHSDWVKSEFEAMNPGVTVNFVVAGEVVEDRLGIYLQIFEAQSSELDVAQIDVIWPGDLAEHFLDLNEFGAGDVSGAHFPAIVENNTVDGKLIGIPWFTDAGLLYYRTDLLEKYGYDGPPATWDELEEMAMTIQEGERAENPDFDGFVWQGRAYEGLTCDALEWIDSHGGGTIVSPDGVITVNNDAAISALERAAGWVGTISPVGVTDYAEEEARGQWQAGNAAFMRNWPYAYSLGNADDSPIAGNFAVTSLPAGPASDSGSATLGGWQLAVSKYSEHPELAAELALFMASEEAQRQNALMTSRIPTVMSLYEDDEVLSTYPWFGDLLPVFTSAAARPSTATAPQYSDTSALFFTAVNSVLIGEKDADEAMAELELELEDLLGFPTGEPSGMTAADEMAEEEEEMDEEMDEEMAMADQLVPAPACEVDLTGETMVLYQQAGREGPLAAILGQGFAYATEDAMTMINREGGICGAEVTVEFGETNYDVEQEISVYEQFRAADPKPFILFTYGSGATVALKDRVIEDQIVNFAAGLNAEAIYVPRGGYTYGAAPIYSDQFAGYLTWLSENWADVKPASAGDEIIVGVIGWPNAFGAGATTPEALAVAEDLGITVLPLEEQPLSPDADVSGQVQNMIVSGANVIWNQSLSFSVAQVVGTVHALGFWEDVQVSGVNWSMHNDVPAFLGDNPQLMDGYCGMFPYAYWSDTDIVGVQAAMTMFDEAGRPESDRSTTYLTTFGQFLAVRDIMIETVNRVGSADISGEDVINTMVELGTVSGGDISIYDIDAETRSPRQSQIRCISWDGSQLNWDIIEGFFELPDTRPPAN